MRPHSWVILAGLVLFFVPGAARAQEEIGAPPPSGTAPSPDGPGGRGNGRRVEGVIVSVRGDVIQIRPRFGTQLTRILVDEEASLSRQGQVRPDQLRAGEWVSGMGEVDAQGAVRLRFLQVAEERGAFSPAGVVPSAEASAPARREQGVGAALAKRLLPTMPPHPATARPHPATTALRPAAARPRPAPTREPAATTHGKVGTAGSTDRSRACSLSSSVTTA
jgi:hypothetical protein